MASAEQAARNLRIKWRLALPLPRLCVAEAVRDLQQHIEMNIGDERPTSDGVDLRTKRKSGSQIFVGHGACLVA